MHDIRRTVINLLANYVRNIDNDFVANQAKDIRALSGDDVQFFTPGDFKQIVDEEKQSILNFIERCNGRKDQAV
jgi:hypothetical protein